MGIAPVPLPRYGNGTGRRDFISVTGGEREILFFVAVQERVVGELAATKRESRQQDPPVGNRSGARRTNAC